VVLLRLVLGPDCHVLLTGLENWMAALHVRGGGCCSTSYLPEIFHRCPAPTACWDRTFPAAKPPPKQGRLLRYSRSSCQQRDRHRIRASAGPLPGIGQPQRDLWGECTIVGIVSSLLIGRVACCNYRYDVIINFSEYLGTGRGRGSGTAC